MSGPETDPDASVVEVVVVPREMYAPTLRTVGLLLCSTPPDVRITLVRGGMPNHMADAVVALDPARVRVVGPGRHLAPNAARNIGLRHATSTYVAFIDNDVDTGPGWLAPLLDTAAATDAWAVRPLVLQRFAGKVTVHEAGGDCRIVGDGPERRFVETHRHYGRSPDDVDLIAEQVELFEFHAVVFHRARLIALGGPDERLLSQGDHLDLALRVQQAGGTIWLAPESKVTYTVPARVGLRELPFFLGRWSRTWNRASQVAFCTRFDLDATRDDCGTWAYGDFHRTYAWRPYFRPLGRLTQRIFGRDASKPAAIAFDRCVGRFAAEAALALSPGWKGGGTEEPA